MLGGGEPTFIIHDCADERDATRRAQGKFDRDARERSSASFNLRQGRVDIDAEVNVTLTGLRPGQNGDWFTKSVTQTADGSGYSSRVVGE